MWIVRVRQTISAFMVQLNQNGLFYANKFIVIRALFFRLLCCFPNGNVLQGKPVATESRYPTLIHDCPSVCIYFCVTIPQAVV